MIVIDSSAFSKFLLKETGWDTVAIYIKSNLTVYAVDILVVETTNVIWKYLMLYKKIAETQAIGLYNTLLKLVEAGVVSLEKSEKFLDDALKIGIQYNISIYDSLFLAFAKSLDAKLITSDMKQKVVADKLALSSVYIE